MKSVVRQQHNDRAGRVRAGVEGIEHPSYLLVGKSHTRQVRSHRVTPHSFLDEPVVGRRKDILIENGFGYAKWSLEIIFYKKKSRIWKVNPTIKIYFL